LEKLQKKIRIVDDGLMDMKNELSQYESLMKTCNPSKVQEGEGTAQKGSSDQVGRPATQEEVDKARRAM